MSVRRERLICVIGACLLQSACSVYDEAMLENTEQRGATRKREETMLASGSVMRMRDAGEHAPDAAPAPPKPARTPSMQTAMTDSMRESSSAEREQDDAGRTSEDASSPSSDAGAPSRPTAEASMACRGRVGYLSSADGHCYFPLPGPVTWYMARDECANAMAHLATLTSDREQSFVASFGVETDAWLGLSRFGSSNFSWVTSEVFSYANWQQGGPDQLPESAVIMAPFTGLWSNRSPHELHSALCETEP
jgi:hypothetical protein